MLPVFLLHTNAAAQTGNNKIQYPKALMNASFGVSTGVIGYKFSVRQLENGFTAENVQVPRPAVRIVLYGKQFNKWLSAQVTYMRPVDWVKYKNVNGDQKEHSVWMNVAGLTVVANIPLHKKISFCTEAGLGIITRKGFSVGNVRAVTDAVYGTLLTGGALACHFNPKWDLRLGAVYSPACGKEKQPATVFFGAGFSYHLRALTDATIQKISSEDRYFPRQVVQIGYTTNRLGYGVNNAVSKGPVPIFWGGEVHLRQGVNISYQRNIFRARKVFAFDWGVAAGWWQTRQDRKNFITLSAFPVLKFMVYRSASLALFLEYAVAGPTYISQTQMDDKATGRRFTFMDFMGLGTVWGKERKLHAGLRIAHFSNGNIYPQNDGVKVPLTFSVGYNMK